MLRCTKKKNGCHDFGVMATQWVYAGDGMTAPTVTSHRVSTDRYRLENLRAGLKRGAAGMVKLPQPACSCSDCVSRDCCLGSQLTALTDNHPAALVRHNHTLSCREHLFRTGDKPEALYVVKSGAVKLYLMSEDGSEQVVAFYMPGEVLGLDALGTGVHRSSAVVLERASFCVIPLASLEKVPGCHPLLYKLLSLELVRDHHTIELITKKDAEAKMANFLIGLSERFRARGFSASSFNLSMKRNEIGSHLGLAVETVSRILTRFQEDGLIRVRRRQVEIRNFAGLETLAGCHAAHVEVADYLRTCKAS
jgi:CRP/FNR family transcriptional regulator